MQTDAVHVQGLFEYLKSQGLPGLVIGYLIWKDMYKPWLSKKNGKSNVSSQPQVNVKDFATSKDVNDLGSSFREFRAESTVFHNDMLQRVTRVETRCDGLERAEDRDK